MLPAFIAMCSSDLKRRIDSVMSTRPITEQHVVRIEVERRKRFFVRRRGAIFGLSLFYIFERNVLREFDTSHFISRRRLGILLM